MENQLSYVFMLSLKEISLRQLAVSLWNEPDILDLIEKYSDVSKFYCVYPAYWRETIEREVTNKVSKLKLPKALTKELLLIVTPVGLQIKQWKRFHESYLKMPGPEDRRIVFDAPTLAKLNWTAAGTVNYKATAEELIRCKMVDIVKRYTIACLYCLEDCIPVLWEELPDEFRRKFYNEEDTSQSEMLPNLESCWPYILKGEQSRLDCRFRTNNDQRSFNQCVFMQSACCGNKAASEYFFQKLTREEKEASFIRRTAIDLVSTSGLYSGHFPLDKSCDALCYLLSLMNQEQRMEFFKVKDVCVLMRFLSWPWQDVFIKIAKLFWDLCPPGVRNYDILLHLMSSYFKNSKYYFPKLFQEFFMRSPVNFRKRFVDLTCRTKIFFPEFFDSQDVDTMTVVFRNVEEVDRVRIVSSEIFVKFLHHCTLMDRWPIIEVCLQETIQSEDGKEKLKEAFWEFLKRRNGTTPMRSRPFNRFLKLLNEMGGSAQNKRCLEDDTLNEAKKLCSDK